MADEQAAIATELGNPAIGGVVANEVEIETEVPESILDQDDESDLEESGSDGLEGEGEGEDELSELDFGFKKYSVPKSLKEGVEALRADYTQKTQSASERAKALDEREASITKQAEATEAELDARATLRSVEATLAEYAKLTPQDWQAHMQADPLGTQQHRMQYEDLKAQKAELEGKVSQAQAERTEKAQQDLAKRVQETLEAAPTIIPGITAETRGPAIDKLVAFAQSEGIPDQVLRDNWSPTLLQLLHKAHIGSLAIAKQSAPKAPAQAPVQPLATVRSATSPKASRSLGDIAKSDDMEAYAAARAAGRKR